MRIAMVVVGLGCAGEGRFTPPGPEPEPEVEDRIVQVTQPLADVLFVIDDSGSMEDDQAAIASELPRFVETLDGWGVDYHVGVVTTDTEDDATRGRLVGPEPRVVTADLADPAGVLAERVRVGTGGAGTERGLHAAWLALEAQRNRPENAGFARREAALSTIVVSDEDDETDADITPSGFVDWYRALRDDPSDRTFSAVVALRTLGQSRRGRRYLSVAEQIGGEVADIDRGDWASALEGLGLRTAGLRRDYVLSAYPVVETLDVTLERAAGSEVELIEVEGFRYVWARNSVELDVVPQPQDVVVIRYVEYR